MIAHILIAFQELAINAGVVDAGEVIVEAPLRLGRQIAQLPQHIKKYIKISYFILLYNPITN